MFDSLKKLFVATQAPARDPDLGQLEAAIAPIREGYQYGLRLALEQARREHGQAATAEIMIDFGKPSIFPRDFERIDCLIRLSEGDSPGAPVKAKSLVVRVPPQQPALTTLELPGLRLQLQPFQWGDCQFLLTGDAKPELEGMLVQWFEFWMDIEDERPRDADGLQSVIHSASFSAVETGSWHLQVDFGSAPTAAFLELVRKLGSCFAGQASVESAPLAGPS